MEARKPDADEGGDAACWLSKLCPECGAMLETPDRCWRCEARFGTDDVPTAT